MSYETKRKAIENAIDKVNPYAREVEIEVGVLDWDSPGILIYRLILRSGSGLDEFAKETVGEFLGRFDNSLMEVRIINQKVGLQ